MKTELFKRLAFLVVIVVLPTVILIKNYSSQNGFLALILFGQEFKATRLKEINEINPPTKTRFGYDGQFYAQIALNPLLTRSDISRALDNPTYRSTRIGLPFLAFCLGLGKPTWILHIYALLNFVFWFILLALLYHFVGFQQNRDFLLTMALLWSTGTLTSIARALTDLPAATLSVFAMFLITNRTAAASLLGSAAMFREASVLSFLTVAWPEKKWDVTPKRLFVSCLIMTLPIAAWLAYVLFKMGGGVLTGNLLAPPFSGVLHKLSNEFVRFFEEFSKAEISWIAYLLFELVCPISLIIQSLYLILKPRFDSAIWRLGFGFAILLYLLPKACWVEQLAYGRILLPLTISFNFLIHKHEHDVVFVVWYVFGNIGMTWMCLEILRGSLLRQIF